MSNNRHSVAVLIDKNTDEQRSVVLDRFRTGVDRVLITMHTVSHAIDVGRVASILNFDMPVKRSGEADFETYSHCVSRAGSFGMLNRLIKLKIVCDLI